MVQYQIESDGRKFPKELDDYNWEAAFDYSEFTREEVDRILAIQDGCNDGPDWLLVCQLKNGRYGFLSACCDYTGWDCQSWGESDIQDTFQELCRMSMSDADRLALKITEIQE